MVNCVTKISNGRAFSFCGPKTVGYLLNDPTVRTLSAVHNYPKHAGAGSNGKERWERDRVKVSARECARVPDSQRLPGAARLQLSRAVEKTEATVTFAGCLGKTGYVPIGDNRQVPAPFSPAFNCGSAADRNQPRSIAGRVNNFLNGSVRSAKRALPRSRWGESLTWVSSPSVVSLGVSMRERHGGTTNLSARTPSVVPMVLIQVPVEP